MSNAYRVYCEDCDLDEVYNPENPPEHVVDYWGSVEKARQQWSAKSAAKGARDDHRMSEFRNYDEGLRHRVHLEEIGTESDDAEQAASEDSSREPSGHESHNALDHLGEECPSCGVVHRVVESIPDKPLSGAAIDSLGGSQSVKFIQGVEFFTGDMAGPNAEEVTENLVLSTSSSTMLLSRYAGTGWVVEQDIEHDPDEDPEQVGRELWTEASQSLSAAMNEVF